MRENRIRYSRYTLPNGRKVFLTQRPDVVSDKQEILDWIARENVVVRFQYTDDWVDYPEVVPSKWFLWVPGKHPTIETVYPSIVTLNHYDKTLPIEQSIWMHCDSSSMRAPTYFGLFLHAVYPDKVKEISDTITVHPVKDTEYASYSRPDKYAEISFRLDLELKGLIDAWNISEKEAHSYLMNTDKKNLHIT